MGEAEDDRGARRRSVGLRMQRVKPPFRADHVGSLLRTAPLKEAREKRARGKISADELTEIEDREIESVIRKQEMIGLRSATDGEYRRISWNYDFLENLDNVESYVGERKIKFAASGPQPRPILLRVIGKLGGYKPHPMVEHFKFLKAHAKETPKLTIPSPSSLHFRYGRDVVPEKLYPSMNDFYRDLGETHRKAVRAFADAGCRYLQLDEVNLAYLCDPTLRKQITDRGEDPAALPGIYAGMINAAISDIPPDMTITMHLCRGNFRSSFVASGGYEPVAELLFNQINVHGYFMEYDTERAGGFEPLRFVPKGKTVVLGLVTSKSGRLESRDEIKRRIEQAAKFVDIDQLCLSPQCGFASTEEGNVLAEEEEWAKLRMIVEIADEVWG
jgi:5-methyltetrahydropteroyltriglutamate--homocysteine methyltransferase